MVSGRKAARQRGIRAQASNFLKLKIRRRVQRVKIITAPMPAGVCNGFQPPSRSFPPGLIFDPLCRLGWLERLEGLGVMGYLDFSIKYREV